ncbi:MAG: hypothetical protein M0P71_16565 [Melioribacteraceae bacterium]|nr:hypothetical protein [Melioribacteraceae bacterium]
MYSNHKNFRVQDLLKVKQLVLADSVVTKIMPDTLVNTAFVRAYVTEHGGGSEVFANTGLYKDEDTIKLGADYNTDVNVSSNNGSEFSITTENTISTGDVTIDTNSIGLAVTRMVNSELNFISLNLYNDPIPLFTIEATGLINANSLQINYDSSGFYYFDDPDMLLWSDNHLITKRYADSVIFGSMYAHNVTQVVDIIASDQMKSIPGSMTIGNCLGFTLQGDSALVTEVAGTYLITYSISAQVTAGEEWESAIMINNELQEETSAHSESTQGATTRPQVNSGTAILILAENDLVTLGVDNHVSAGDVTVFHANITLLKLKE